MIDFEKYIQAKVAEALEKCFTDAVVFGQGYVKVVYLDGDIDIKHIPFENVEAELEYLQKIKKYTETM
jgi:hypothetical protein